MFDKIDLHIHFPAGAIPKDGPSAGVTITTAIVSLLLNRKVKDSVAMTGEITLKG
jgi:ATP-dependent Lon protease